MLDRRSVLNESD
ncbi:Putative uncharacterized protein [Escherichia coli D6-117.29]|nr:Protein of unknown function [Escherichia coli]CDP75006.1 Putative uncharacterized protein [Escherichia coli D6-117.29]CDU40930.1 Protein of unknown function [Escherichia coli]